MRSFVPHPRGGPRWNRGGVQRAHQPRPRRRAVALERCPASAQIEASVNASPRIAPSAAPMAAKATADTSQRMGLISIQAACAEWRPAHPALRWRLSHAPSRRGLEMESGTPQYDQVVLVTDFKIRGSQEHGVIDLHMRVLTGPTHDPADPEPVPPFRLTPALAQQLIDRLQAVLTHWTAPEQAPPMPRH